MVKPTNQFQKKSFRVTHHTYDTPNPPPTVTPTEAHDNIARRAYELYVKNGCRQGQCEQNWLLAEQEINKFKAENPRAY